MRMFWCGLTIAAAATVGMAVLAFLAPDIGLLCAGLAFPLGMCGGWLMYLGWDEHRERCRLDQEAS